jgi:hypothetical protein
MKGKKEYSFSTVFSASWQIISTVRQLHVNVYIYSSASVLIPLALRPQMCLPQQPPDDRPV